MSHDRYFLDRICDGLFIIQNQHLRYVNGGYSQQMDTSTKVEKEKTNSLQNYKKHKPVKLKMTYQEKKEFETIEDDISHLEKQMRNIEDKMEHIIQFDEIFKLTKQRDELQDLLDEKNERFLYLLELQEQIDQQ